MVCVRKNLASWGDAVAKKKKIKITLTVQRFEESELKKELGRLFSDLANATDEIRKTFFNIFKTSSELVSLECGVATGAVILVLLKPSQRLLDLGAAVRAGDLNRLVVEQAHGFSFVENELVELSILPTSEKPTN